MHNAAARRWPAKALDVPRPSDRRKAEGWRPIAKAAVWAMAWSCATHACISGPDRSGATSTAQDTHLDATVLSPPSHRPDLRPVALPDFSRMANSVQRQMLGQAEALRTQISTRSLSTADLSAAYGRMGTLLMAAEQVDAAEICYVNAQKLEPRDARWPYYLGQLYRIKGPVTSAAASFERALELRPDDVPTLVWLGEVYLTQGRIDDAGQLFSRVLNAQPKLVPALFGAGRVALARKEYASAVNLLEECLALDSRATATHYPLAMAYRGLGNTALAQAHLERKGDVKIQPVDPLMAELNEVLESPRAYDIRGGRSLETGDWADAAAQFRKGLALEPSDPVLRLRLGTTLFQMGDPRGARQEFERILQSSPEYARAHHSLGLLAAADGRYGEALERFTAAVKYESGDPSSRVALAGLLRREGRSEEALEQYDAARHLDPRRPDATLGYIVTLSKLRRHTEARDRLVEATKAYPDEPEFAHALARLLASAPDARVRDGRRALAIAETLLKAQQTPDRGETLAMALAELGRYEQAAAVQRDVIDATARAGLDQMARHMDENLRLYERGAPCRTPWRDDEMP